jgi:hypothetical protein
MATEICLTIADDGKMYVSSEEAAMEMAEGAEPMGGEDKGTPVANIDEALAAIKELAQAGSMAPVQGDVELPAAPSEAQPPAQVPAGAAGQPGEEEAMLQAFGKR